MSAIDNYEIPPPHPGTMKTRPKKLIHFSDGSTMEVEDNDDSVDNMEGKLVKEVEIHPSSHHSHHQNVAGESTSMPSVDPKSLSWREWIKHYSIKGASSAFNGLEYSGESLAYYLGITSPKYQHEIDEYNRMVTKKALDDAEIKAWSSGGSSSSSSAAVPIVMEQVRADKNCDDPHHDKVEEKV